MNNSQINRAELARRLFEAVLPVMMAEAKSPTRHLNPWFSSKARGLPEGYQAQPKAA